MILLLPLILVAAYFLTTLAQGRPSKGNKCILAKIQAQSVDGKTLWETQEDYDTSQRDCNEFCANVRHNVTSEADNNVRSATCFKNDGKSNPFVDDKGNNQSGPWPTRAAVSTPADDV